MKTKIHFPSHLRTILFLLMALFFVNGNVWAQDTEDSAEIRPFPDMDPEVVLQGKLDHITKKGASIDGVRRTFSESVLLLTWDAKSMKRREFFSGIPVGFLVDSAGDISALWNLRPELMPLP